MTGGIFCAVAASACLILLGRPIGHLLPEDWQHCGNIFSSAQNRVDVSTAEGTRLAIRVRVTQITYVNEETWHAYVLRECDMESRNDYEQLAPK